MLQAGLGDRVQHLQRLVEVVVAVMAVGDLELEAQLELGVGDLLEAVLDLARLDEGHDLAVESGGVRRVQVQDLVAYLQRETVFIKLIESRYPTLSVHIKYYKKVHIILIKQKRFDLIGMSE